MDILLCSGSYSKGAAEFHWNLRGRRRFAANELSFEQPIALRAGGDRHRCIQLFDRFEKAGSSAGIQGGDVQAH